ncbi:hypothetical protein DICPUDRAFT_16899, partial [Dictyostelium purpureum]
FMKIIRNKIIFREILYHCKLYKINRKLRILHKNDLLKYPEREYITHLELYSQYLPLMHEIPPSVRAITIGEFYKQEPLTSGVIPNTVNHLILGRNYSNKLAKDSIPNSINTLEFCSPCIIEECYIPPSVTTVKYHGPKIHNTLPRSVKYLVFSNSFNYPIEKLSISSTLSFNDVTEVAIIPNFIETLEFGKEYNQIIKPFSLPLSIKTIIFGDRYNQPLEVGSIPFECTTLVLVKNLVFSDAFDYPIENYKIPHFIETIEFGKEYNQFIKPLSIHSSIKTIIFGDRYNRPLEIGSIPFECTTLVLENNYNILFTKNLIPPTITNLYIRTSFLKPIKKGIPSSVKHLSLGHSFIKTFLPGAIPDSVTSIEILFNSPITFLPNNNVISILPSSIETLSFGESFNHSIDKGLPSSLTKL